ncbi:MAG: tRNA (adenosine(37)-N6)-threonylcarbamoyltransferase complex ATPase subunit type 1 TsaE [Candidatus Nealsonbacteria bacterium]
MKQKEYITNSFKETRKLGEEIAEEILKKRFKNQVAFVIGLKGELGGGKTTFLQGFAKGLNIKEKILSPTFVIFKKFKIPACIPFTTGSMAGRPACNVVAIAGRQKLNNNLYHFDCYRIKGQKDLLDLGFKEIISNQSNIVVIEWADKIKKIMPKNSIWIEFKVVNENKRKIIIKS